jgi:hypothetical protein
VTSDPLDDRLKEALHQLAATRDVPLTVDPLAAVRRRVRVRRAKHRAPVVIGLAAGLVAIVVAAGVILRDGDQTGRLRAGRSHRAPPPSIYSGVTMLDPGPLAPRRNAAFTWTGGELVIWGGVSDQFVTGGRRPYQSFTDGAAYNPETEAWRRMPAAPLPAGDAVSVASATTSEVVIARGTGTAAWSLEGNSWRALSPAPRPVEDLERLSDATLISASANAMLDVRSGRWRTLSEPPATLKQTHTAWTGRDLIVVGQSANQSFVALSYRPENDSWRALRSPTALSANAVASGWTGRDLVAVDYGLHAESYDPTTDSWTPLPQIPARFFEWYPGLHAEPNSVTAFLANGFAVVDGSRRWTVMPYRLLDIEPITFGRAAPATAPSATQGRFFVSGVKHDGSATLELVDPLQLARSTRQIQVGVATVTVAEGTKVGTWTTDTNSNRARVAVNVATPAGACQIGSAEPRAPDVNGAPSGWQSDPTGRAWSTHATSTDTVDVSCDSAATTRDMVGHIELPGSAP